MRHSRLVSFATLLANAPNATRPVLGPGYHIQYRP